MKKLIAMLLSVSLCTACLTACGNDSSDVHEPSSSTKDSSSASDSIAVPDSSGSEITPDSSEPEIEEPKLDPATIVMASPEKLEISNYQSSDNNIVHVGDMTCYVTGKTAWADDNTVTCRYEIFKLSDGEGAKPELLYSTDKAVLTGITSDGANISFLELAVDKSGYYTSGAVKEVDKDGNLLAETTIPVSKYYSIYKGNFDGTSIYNMFEVNLLTSEDTYDAMSEKKAYDYFGMNYDFDTSTYSFDENWAYVNETTAYEYLSYYDTTMGTDYLKGYTAEQLEALKNRKLYKYFGYDILLGETKEECAKNLEKAKELSAAEYYYKYRGMVTMGYFSVDTDANKFTECTYPYLTESETCMFLTVCDGYVYYVMSEAGTDVPLGTVFRSKSGDAAAEEVATITVDEAENIAYDGWTTVDGERLYYVYDGTLKAVDLATKEIAVVAQNVASYNIVEGGVLCFIGADLWYCTADGEEKHCLIEDSDTANVKDNLTICGEWIFYTAKDDGKIYRTRLTAEEFSVAVGEETEGTAEGTTEQTPADSSSEISE